MTRNCLEVEKKVNAHTLKLTSFVKYNPVFEKLTKGNTTGALMFLNLEMYSKWMNYLPFYKFSNAPAYPHPAYKKNDSWAEILMKSDYVIRAAFETFGIRYKSKEAFEKAEDKFQGKLYAAYYDRTAHLIFYVRNHELVEAELCKLQKEYPHMFSLELEPETQSEPPQQAQTKAPVITQTPTTIKEQPESFLEQPESFSEQPESFSEQPENFSGQLKNFSGQLKNFGFQYHRVNNTKKTKQQQHTNSQMNHNQSCCCDPLIYPEKLCSTELKNIQQLLKICPTNKQQDVLDEITAAINMNKIQKSITGYARKLILSAKSGTFMLNLGIALQRARALALQMKSLTTISPQDMERQNQKLAETKKQSNQLTGNSRARARDSIKLAKALLDGKDVLQANQAFYNIACS